MEKGTFTKAEKALLYQLIESDMPCGIIPLSIQEAIDNAEEPLDVHTALSKLVDESRLALIAVENYLGRCNEVNQPEEPV